MHLGIGSALARHEKDHTQRSQRLLIVDDIADNRAVLGRRFQRRGFEVFEADNGPRALAMIAAQRFDVVLLDVMMPEMDGFEVLRRIREHNAPTSLPVIMVTAKSQSADIVQALESGANDYVTKPVDFDIALARVNTQLQRKIAEEAVVRSNEALRKINDELENRVQERTARLVEANEQLRTEIEQRQKSEEKSQFLAYHDPLTGLGNRRLFRKELERLLSSIGSSSARIGVIFVDLDGFKSVNDALGHSMGDALLKVVASRLRSCVPSNDIIARLGGDEFALLHVADDQPDSSLALAAEIVSLAGMPITVDGHELTVGASIGVAIASRDNCDPEHILKCADLAMYRAKAAGRGTYRLFSAEMDLDAQTRRGLEISLRNAVARGDFHLLYQPIFTLQSKTVSGFEALLRWRHPERGLVSPSEFVPVAEDIGLIIPLGEWALREACREAVKWPGNINVAVNLSPVQFTRGNLVSTVISALASSGLPPDRLELEITESVLLERTEKNFALLNQLRDIGVRISMDDFGTGYSSMSYLRNFRFDKIKIDQSFIRDISRGEEGRAIVRAIANLGSSFGITTTAEGVETSEQLDYLDLEGCTEVQGRIFSMPISATEIASFLKVANGGQSDARGSAYAR